MDEIVKYENSLNRIPLTGLTREDLDLFMYICHRVRDNGDSLLRFTYYEIKKAIGREDFNNAYFDAEIQNMANRLKRIEGSVKGEEFNLFSTFVFTAEPKEHIRFGKLDACTMIVRVNEDYLFLFNELDARFMAFELQEYVKLESKYSKNLYRLLKQWRTQGKTSFYEADLIRALMDCPSGYKSNDFMQKILEPASKELQEKGCFRDLKIICERDPSKRGRPVKGYSFTFKAEKKDAPTEDTPAVEDKKPRQKKASAPDPKNRFNNFQQRDYDFAELERKLQQGSPD